MIHEIIDVDMDEDRNDVVFVKGKIESNKKMKGISLEGSSSAPQLDSMIVESNKKGKVYSIFLIICLVSRFLLNYGD